MHAYFKQILDSHCGMQFGFEREKVGKEVRLLTSTLRDRASLDVPLSFEISSPFFPLVISIAESR